MDIHSEVLRYMGHIGTADTQLEELVASCMEKLLNVCTPRSTTISLPCTVTETCVKIDKLNIKSSALASRMKDCAQAYLLAATLGADVDRLITQRMKMDSAEALCLQACAAVKIEEYCDSIEHELSDNIKQCGFYNRPRFSPGYGDFDIAYQTGLLQILNAQNRIGVSETKTHMLTPLKSVTAVIGVCAEKSDFPNKCDRCNKTDCQFAKREAVHD
jgi:hypothetical protein